MKLWRVILMSVQFRGVLIQSVDDYKTCYRSLTYCHRLQPEIWGRCYRKVETAVAVEDDQISIEYRGRCGVSSKKIT